jgi:hypothetical protein
LDDIPILVNGDDLGFRGDDHDYSIWQKITSFAGLIPSVGKTYKHDKYFTLNSEMWKFNRCTLKGTPYYFPQRIKHIEMGKCRGSIKGGTASTNPDILKSDDRVSLCRTTMWQEFLTSCPKQVNAWRFMWTANYDLIKDAVRRCPKIAVCLPKWAGGLGFPAPCPSSEFYESRKPTPHQLMMAQFAIENPNNRKVSSWVSETTTRGLHSLSLFRMREFMEATRSIGVTRFWTDSEDQTEVESPVSAICYANNTDYTEDRPLNLQRLLSNLCHQATKSSKMWGRFSKGWEEAWQKSKNVLKMSSYIY